MLTYSRYKRSRFWAVYDGDELLCVTVYLKGALAVVERLTGVRPERPKRKRKPLPLVMPRKVNLRELTLSHILEAAVNAQSDDGNDELETLLHIEALAREGLRVSQLTNAPQS
jgi:hypothetical protein